MHDIQSPPRRRNQSEIDQLVREFWDSGFNQRVFAEKIGVHPLTVARWIRSNPFDGTQPPVRSAGREITPSSPAGFVAVEVRQSPSGRPIPASVSCDWPEIVTPNGWKLRVPLGTKLGWVGELLAQLPQC